MSGTNVRTKFTPFASAVESGRIARGKKTFFTRFALPAIEKSESFRHPAVKPQTMMPETRN